MSKEIKHDEERLDFISQAIYKSTVESYNKKLDYRKQVERIKLLIKTYITDLKN
jgi:hypothetical protein